MSSPRGASPYARSDGISSCTCSPVWAPDQTLLPTLDYASASEDHWERLAAVVAVVEFHAIGGTDTYIVDDHGVAVRSGVAGACDDHGAVEFGRKLLR